MSSILSTYVQLLTNPQRLYDRQGKRKSDSFPVRSPFNTPYSKPSTGQPSSIVPARLIRTVKLCYKSNLIYTVIHTISWSHFLSLITPPLSSTAAIAGPLSTWYVCRALHLSSKHLITVHLAPNLRAGIICRR
jgi:hypothetical protein